MRQNKLRRRYATRTLALDLPLPAYAEYAYYALLVNAIMAAEWGISVPLAGAGAMALLAVYCLKKLKGPFSQNYMSLRLPVACALFCVAIQLLVYEESLNLSDNRAFIIWVIQLIIVQSLLLRAGFLHRFAVATFLIGLSLLPYINLNYGGAEGGVERAGLEGGVGYANPNDLAGWFGFCCVYFFVRSFQETRSKSRLLFLILAAANLFVVGLTVSRTALGAIAIAGTIVMRHTLKRGFLPILLVVLLGFGFSVSGIFDQIVGNYEERGSEDSGRFALWPLAVERLIDSPLAGVEDIATYVPEFMKEITPHNGFLYIGLTAGVLPLILFTAYWVNAFRGAFKLSKGAMQDAPFQLPLIIYIFIISSFSATGFMYPWAIVVLCNAIPRPRIPNRIIRFGLLRHGSVGQPAVNRAPSYALRGVALPPTKQLPVRQVSTKYKI